jgi:hypothetical protein
MSPAWVAQDLGLFTKHGLQHSLNYLAATTAIQAIVGGTEEIGLVGNQGIDVALEGADTVYIASTAPRFIFHCTATLPSKRCPISRERFWRPLSRPPRRTMPAACCCDAMD